MPLMHQFVEHLKERDFRTVAIYLLDAQFMGEAPADVSPRLDTGIHTHTHTHAHTKRHCACDGRELPLETQRVIFFENARGFILKTRVASS